MENEIITRLDRIICLLETLTDSPRDEQWMTPSELSRLTGSSKSTLDNLRSARKRYPFYRPVGSRTPLYKRSEIYALIEHSHVDVRP